MATRAHGETLPCRLRAFGARSSAVPFLLALPLVFAIAALRGLTVALPTFHGSDERVYIYPTVLRFARQLPYPDLHAYSAAQTPLFFILMAYIGKLIGFAVWRLRLVNCLISWALALGVYSLLRRRMALARRESTVLAWLFLLSPYVFGSAFRVLTDNLALLFVVVALERLERFRQTDAVGPFLVACLCAGAAILTRQSTAYILGLAALYVLRPRAALTARSRWLLLLAVVAAAVPAGLLFLSWHGLVPIGGDPSSCGLCAAGHDSGAQSLEVPTTELALATIGLYGTVLFAPLLVRRLRDGMRLDLAVLWRSVRWPLAAAGAGAVLLLIFPARPGPHGAGYLWQLSAHLPNLLGSSLLLWALVPVGGIVLTIRLTAAPSRFLACAFVACFLLSTLVIRFPWQKYVDPFALLAVMLTIRPREMSSRFALAGAAVLAAIFIAYAVDDSAHDNTTATHGSSAMVQGARVLSRR